MGATQNRSRIGKISPPRQLLRPIFLVSSWALKCRSRLPLGVPRKKVTAEITKYVILNLEITKYVILSLEITKFVISKWKITYFVILFFSANIHFQGPSGHAFDLSGAHKNDAGWVVSSGPPERAVLGWTKIIRIRIIFKNRSRIGKISPPRQLLRPVFSVSSWALKCRSNWPLGVPRKKVMPPGKVGLLPVLPPFETVHFFP